MPDAFLDSSVVIGLFFRNRGERKVCEDAVPITATLYCSRYVIFEVSRGFLRNLINLHNISFEHESFADLHQAAHSGQLRFKRYAMETWLGAFDDYFAEMALEQGSIENGLDLFELRAKIRGWVRRGWRKMVTKCAIINDIGCRPDITAPFVRSDDLLDQRLPLEQCGQPTACELQSFMRGHASRAQSILDGLRRISNPDKETARRIEAIHHLSNMVPGKPFSGSNCHSCGDALICLESPSTMWVITKNGKHFEPLVGILRIGLSIAKPAKSTK
ncbi:MAG TPA: hypothetical protein VMF06_18200 [Candidatus Limnocylindria bacterium]|jgi:hypothetical protein|nr:hypothetical protein [Candidatus Limnocylindria bacterium]